MVSASRSILLEVLAHVPIDFAQCLHCEYLSGLAQVGLPVHREIQHSYPPEVLEEAGRLVAWLQKIVERHGKNLRVHVIEPQSPQGFFKSLLYGIRRYPAFIIDRRVKYIGWDAEILDGLLTEYICGERRADAPAGLFNRVARAASEFIYGATTYEWVCNLRQERGEIERLFVLLTFGDLIGLPVLPPYYVIRLLPYVVPTIERWKRSLLRERDLTDLSDLIEGIH